LISNVVVLRGDEAFKWELSLSLLKTELVAIRAGCYKVRKLLMFSPFYVHLLALPLLIMSGSNMSPLPT
jgi:hypothetical protein